MVSGQATSELQCSAIFPLPKRADFLRLRTGKKHGCRLFTLQTKANTDNETAIRVGLTVTTKVGNAVVRNRIKRRLRSAVKQVFPGSGRPGYDYVVIAREPTLRARFPKLINELTLALDHVHGNGAKGSQISGGLKNRAS